jgi:hypothetical protein
VQVGAALAANEEALHQARRNCEVEVQERRKLHNTILELRGNIRVFVRARPCFIGESNCLAFPRADWVAITPPAGTEAARTAQVASRLQ